MCDHYPTNNVYCYLKINVILLFTHIVNKISVMCNVDYSIKNLQYYEASGINTHQIYCFLPTVQFQVYCYGYYVIPNKADRTWRVLILNVSRVCCKLSIKKGYA